MTQHEVKKHYSEIDIARGLGIILVVLGHAFPDAALEGGVQPSFGKYIFNCIYSFHMPLFVFLAGFVTHKLYKKTAEKTMRIKQRALRLLLPYVVWSLIYIPFRILLSSISSTPFDLTRLWCVLIGESPYSGLWFLYALFLIDAIRTICCSTENSDVVLLALGAVFLVAGKLYVFPEPINWIFYCTFYYACGIIARRYYAKIKAHLGNTYILTGAILVLLSANYFFPRGNDLPYRFVSIVTAIAGITIILGISIKIRQNSLLEQVGSYSMDIYIISGPLLVILRTVLYFKLNVPYSIYVCIAVIMAIMCSIMLSKLIIRKNRILSLSLLGDNRW